MGTFADVHEEAFLVSEVSPGYSFRYQAHSIWFQSVIELGYLGLTILVLGFAITIYEVWRVPPDRRGGALAGLIGLVFSSTFLSSFSFKYTWLGLTYAILVVSARRYDRSVTDSPALASPSA